MTGILHPMDRAVPTDGFGWGDDHDHDHDRGRSAREFARARRHSRLVAVLKIGLPLLAAVIVAGGLAVTWLARYLPDNVSIRSTSIDDGRIVMEDPRMSGFDKNDRPYSMIARRAFQSLDGGGIDLEAVRANVAAGAGSTADIAAAKGHYDAGAQTLKLTGGVKVDTSDGMSVLLDAADIDLAGGNMTSPGPVHIATQNQTIEAGSLRVQDGGKVLSFGRKVRMTLLPSSGASSGSSPGEAAQPRLSESN